MRVVPFALECEGVLRVGMELGMLLDRVRYLHFFFSPIYFYLSKHD